MNRILGIHVLLVFLWVSPAATTVFANPQRSETPKTRASQGALPESQRDLLVVGGFHVDPQVDARDAWLPIAIEETLAWRLCRVPTLTVIPTARANQARQELAERDSDPPVEWSRVVRLIGAKRWLRGACAGTPTALTLELELVEPGSTDAPPKRARLGPGRLFEVLDDATRWTLGQLGVARVDQATDALIFAPPAESPSALEYYAKAVAAARSGDISDAVYCIAQAVDYDRRFRPALLLLAKIELRSPPAFRTEADHHLLQVELLANSHADKVVLTELRLAQGLSLLMKGALDPARERFEAALASATERDDPFGKIDALTGLCDYWLNYEPPGQDQLSEEELKQRDAQRLRHAVEWQQRVVHMVRQAGDAIAEPAALNKLALLHEELDEPELALKAHEQTLVAARKTGSARSEATAWRFLGRWYHRQKRWQEALDATRHCLELANDKVRPTVLLTLGEIYRDMGDKKEAISQYEAAYAVLAAGDNLIDQFTCLRAIAEMKMELGDRAAAISKLQAALDIAQVKHLPDESTVREQLEEWKSGKP